MAQFKFEFKPIQVARGMVEVMKSERLFATISLKDAGYRTAVIKIYPKKKGFTWSQLTSSNARHAWKRIGDHLEYEILNTLSGNYHVEMVNIENILLFTCLSIWYEKPKFK